MTIINQKSISGITSITFASAGDDLLTFHSNNGTERFRIDNSGNTKITAGIVTTLTVTGTTTLNGNLDLQDNDKILIGTGDDLEIYHDGSHSYIDDSGTGDLRIRSNNVRFDKYTGETIAQFIGDGRVELYYDNSKKLETKSDGVDITGELQCDSLDVDGAGNISGILNLGNNLDMPDSTKVILGNGDDLQIYHDGTHSYIKDGGTGNLKVLSSSMVVKNAADSEIMLQATQNGSVDLYYDNSKKFETLTNGVRAQGGILFGSDTANANALDDYEEGTWTPTVTSSGSVTGEDAKYTKIGNLVHVYGKLSSFTNRSSSNTIVISGLPYTASTNQSGGSMFARYSDRTAYTVYVYSNKIEFYSIGSGNFTSLQHLHLNNDNAAIYFQATYNVA